MRQIGPILYQLELIKFLIPRFISASGLSGDIGTFLIVKVKLHNYDEEDEEREAGERRGRKRRRRRRVYGGKI